MPTALLFLEFLGTSELLVIAAVALLLFGPRKLPDIGRTIGKSLAEFKRASDDFKRTWEYEVELERRKPAPDAPEEPRPDGESPEQPAAGATSSGLAPSGATAGELTGRAVQAQDEGRTVARDSSGAGEARGEGTGAPGTGEEGDMELNAS